MRSGCISLGGVYCDNCHREISYPERYLVQHEEGKLTRLCVDCSQDKGMVHYAEDKDMRSITFFEVKS